MIISLQICFWGFKSQYIFEILVNNRKSRLLFFSHFLGFKKVIISTIKQWGTRTWILYFHDNTKSFILYRTMFYVNLATINILTSEDIKTSIPLPSRVLKIVLKHAQGALESFMRLRKWAQNTLFTTNHAWLALIAIKVLLYLDNGYYTIYRYIYLECKYIFSNVVKVENAFHSLTNE